MFLDKENLLPASDEYFIYTDVPGGTASIVGSHSIGHSKQKKYTHTYM
jgi:hypothetical protein